MRIKNIAYFGLIVVLISILFAQVHQVGYITGAYLQEHEIKIPHSFAAPQMFDNWENLSSTEQSIVYLSGLGILFLLWIIFVIVIRKSKNPIIIASQFVGTMLFLGYQLWNIISAFSLLFSEKSFGRTGYAIESVGGNPVSGVILLLVIFIVTLALLYLKRFSLKDIGIVFTQKIEFYREFNIIAGLLVALISFSLILTTVRSRPFEIMKFDMLASYNLREEFFITHDLMDEEIDSFKVKGEKEVVINFILNNIDAQYFELRVINEESDITILRDDDLKIDYREVKAEMKLSEGNYQIICTIFNHELSETSIVVKINLY